MKHLFKNLSILIAVGASLIVMQTTFAAYSSIPKNEPPSSDAQAQPISWVTGDDYAAMLTAVAGSYDPYGLYNNASIINQYIQCNITPGGKKYTYTGPNSQTDYVGADRFSPKKVGQFQMLRYCNWVENGRSRNISSENAQTTEDGSYTLNGQTSGIAPSLNPGSIYFFGPGEMGIE